MGLLLSIGLTAGCSGGPAFGSVGAVLARDNQSGQLHVREAPHELAAAKAGLLPGDEIVMIDGQFVRDLDTKEITQRLRGEIGSKVDLTVVRGGEVFHIEVTRTALRAVKELEPPEETLEE
jgi:C-terminal processing protease CtpA/Prc